MSSPQVVSVSTFHITGAPAAHEAELAAAASAAAALTSENQAEIAQGNADTSATAAADRATAAATSATNAATSAGAAEIARGNADTSATAAASRATAATSSQNAAATSASGAANSATAASGSATAASGSAGAASGSATAASGSATTAGTSATNAGTSATNAGTSATNAGTSATNAAASQGAAAGSATNAAASAASVNATATAANRSALAAGSVKFAPDSGHPGLYYLASPTVLAMPSGLPGNASHRVWAADPAWVHPADGAAVDSIRNGGSVGGDLTSTGSARPVYEASDPDMNGLPTLIFDGVDDHLTFDIVDIAAPYWVTVIFRSTGAPASIAVPLGSGGSTRGVNVVATTGLIAANAGTAVSSAVAAGSTPHLVIAQCNGASSNLHVDGGSIATDLGSTAASLFRLGIGGTAAAPASPFAGSIAYAAISTADPLLDANYPTLLALARGYGVTV